MKIEKIKTLGELKKQGYQTKSIKDELRNNLISKLKNKESIFKEIYGYVETVIPELERAILSRHNILFLGLRGQAKTKMARQLINLLDEYRGQSIPSNHTSLCLQLIFQSEVETLQTENVETILTNLTTILTDEFHAMIRV